ncbi:hypothetical protein [Parafrankia discariae]|uniref:hypothetical protein n=1 Tax=Parafrankia discariae TaxID=365528 RepID=UPI0003802569|nr:hypothetical protein [Parafrankia discariae]
MYGGGADLEKGVRVADLEEPAWATEDGPGSAREVVSAWRMASEGGDAAAAAVCLAEEVTVLPMIGGQRLAGKYRFRGRESMRRMLVAAFDLIEGLRYESVTDVGGLWALPYHARIAGHPAAGTQRLKLDSGGLIGEITLLGSAPKVFVDEMERIGPRLVAPPRPRPGQRRARRGRPEPERRIPRADRPDLL